jgi:hypothetical protein
MPAMSTRRVQQAHDLRVASQGQARIPAPMPAPQPQPQRERSSDAFPSFDSEWDVPAFQRKQR